MTTELQTKLDRILALCQQVRETRAKMTPGPWGHSPYNDGGKVCQHLQSQSEGIGSINTWPHPENATGIALEHNVSLALVEIAEIFIQHEIEHGNMFSTKENPSTRLLQRIADIWQKLGLI